MRATKSQLEARAGEGDGGFETDALTRPAMPWAMPMGRKRIRRRDLVGQIETRAHLPTDGVALPSPKGNASTL